MISKTHNPRFLAVVMHASWSEFLLSSTSEQALSLDIHAYLKLDREAFGQNRGIVKVSHWHLYSLHPYFSRLKYLSALHLKPWAFLCFNSFFSVQGNDTILFIYTNRNTALFTVCCSRHSNICILNFFFSCEMRDCSW